MRIWLSMAICGEVAPGAFPSGLADPGNAARMRRIAAYDFKVLRCALLPSPQALFSAFKSHSFCSIPWEPFLVFSVVFQMY